MTWEIWYIDEGFLVWIIPLTYLSNEAVNWVCTADFAMFPFIGFYFKFLILLLLLYYSCLHHALSLMFYSTRLLSLSYYAMHIPCLTSSTISLLAPACLSSRQSFQYILMTWIYRYTRAYPCTPLGIHDTTRWGVFDSPGCSCPDLRVWSLWILPVADQRCAMEAWIIGKPSRVFSFQASLLGSRVSLCDSWVSFV